MFDHKIMYTVPILTTENYAENVSGAKLTFYKIFSIDWVISKLVLIYLLNRKYEVHVYAQNKFKTLVEMGRSGVGRKEITGK